LRSDDALLLRPFAVIFSLDILSTKSSHLRDHRKAPVRAELDDKSERRHIIAYKLALQAASLSYCFAPSASCCPAVCLSVM